MMNYTERQKRITETDRLAWLMCEEAGLNPNETARCHRGDDMVPIDDNWLSSGPYDASPIQLGINGQTVQLAQHKPNMEYVPMWRLFRRHAFQAIAYQRAFDRYMLTEA